MSLLINWRVRCCVLLAAPAALAWVGCSGEPLPEAKMKPPPPSLRLVIVTPHNERIRAKFEDGFGEWHLREHGKAVDIHWVTRGTPRCLDYIEDAATNDELAMRRLVPDLMLGGGISDHRVLVERGFAARAKAPVPGEAQIPATVLGVPLRDEQGYWHATALTAFGIFYNRAALAQREIAPPEHWRDLANAEYYGWVAVADPTRSGSNRFCMSMILQRYGWDEGWGLMLRMAANTRALLPTSDAAIKSVSSGMCLLGLSVNFNALHEAATYGADRLAFVTPSDAIAITPDLITLTNYAAAPELAERFLQFALSERGQVLWSVRSPTAEEKDQPIDPRYAGYALYRYPVVPSIYEKYAGKLSVEGNPYKLESDFVVDMALERRQAKVVPPMLLAACGQNHVLLQRAWKAVIDAGQPAGALAELTRPIVDEQTAYKLGDQYENGGDEAYGLAADWSAKFREKYLKVLTDLGQ